MAVAGFTQRGIGTTPTPTPLSGEVFDYFLSTGYHAKDDTGSVIPLALFTGEMRINANQMVGATTSGAASGQIESTTNDVNFSVLDFDNTADEYAAFQLILPADYDGGTFTAQYIWTADGGTPAQTVSWNMQGLALADDGAYDQAYGTAIEVEDTLIATGDIHVSPASSAITLAGSPAAGQMAFFRIFRDVSEDDLGADARLIAIKITYTKGT